MEFRVISAQHRLQLLATFIFLTGLCSHLVACGGENSAPTPFRPQSVASMSSVPSSSSDVHSSTEYPVQVRYDFVPSSSSDQNVMTRVLQYISSANLSLSVVVTPIGGSAMAAVVGSCTTVTCTVNFVAYPGPNTLAFTLTDTAGGGGKTLAEFSSQIIVQPVSSNTFNLTANPVVNSVVLQLASSTINAGTSGNIAITVQAQDAAGKTIVGPGNYVDANGNPLALFLNASTNQAGGSGSVSLQGPMRLLSPTQAATYLHYNGGWAASGTISASTTGTISGSFTGAILSITPRVVNRYVVPTAASGPYGITVGPNGAIWFSEQNTNKIGQLTVGGTFTEYIIPSSNAEPSIITLGNDGKLWFVEFNTNKIANMTTTGSFSEYLIPTLASGTTYLTVGSDGNIWFTETSSNKIGRFSPSSAQFTEYPIPTSNSSPEGLTNGPDGNIWFSEEATNKIARITSSGTISEYIVPTASSGPLDITTGLDGNIWFTETTGNKIASITPTGIFTEYTIAASGANPRSITPGPDGALWFVEPLNNIIGRVTTSGSFSYYTLPVASAIPLGLVVGPDGNLWLAENNNNYIDKFVY